jgi:hypothetical protein
MKSTAMIAKTLCCILLLFAISISPCGKALAADESEPASESWWSSLPKEDKLLYTSLTAAGFITLYGLLDWDYGSEGWNTADEGWFEEDSKYGGADKVGHLWGTYVLADALTGLYSSYGYEHQTANNYAAISAWLVQAVMEIGDATSESQGFSYEDMVMNTIGAFTSVLMERYPELDRKIDLRLEYVFNVPINGIFDDYSNQFYSVVLKMSGFDIFADNWMQYVEFHGGYYSRGYDSDEVEKERAVYAGVTLNFSQLFYNFGHDKIGKTLEYLQIPYTVPKVKHTLD